VRVTSKRDDVRASVTKLLGTAVVALGLAYACLWWSFQRFYGEFGVSPQDAGLAPSGSPTDLAAAALQLGVWLMIALLVLAIVPTLAVAAAEIAAGYRNTAQAAPRKHSQRRRHDDRDPEADARRRGLAISSAIALLLAAASGWLYWWLVDSLTGLSVIGAAAAVFGLVRYAVTPAVAGLRTRTQPSGSGKDRLGGVIDTVERATPLRLAFGVFLAAAIVGIAFLDLPSDAAQAGACSAKGIQAVPELNIPIPHLHLPILSVHAQPASLIWLTGTPPEGININHIVYLGQSGSSIVVYDPTARHAERIPASSVIVNVAAHSTHCPQVH
jgi:hypothetical protein